MASGHSDCAEFTVVVVVVVVVVVFIWSFSTKCSLFQLLVSKATSRKLSFKQHLPLRLLSTDLKVHHSQQLEMMGQFHYSKNIKLSSGALNNLAIIESP